MTNLSTASLPAPVPHGLADQLARLAHFTAIEHVQPEELDAVALFLLGDVGDAAEKLEFWRELQPDCLRLWSLITADWDADDLDDLHEDSTWWPFSDDEMEQARYQQTRDRLEADIEGTVRRHRYAASEARRASRQPLLQLLQRGLV